MGEIKAILFLNLIVPIYRFLLRKLTFVSFLLLAFNSLCAQIFSGQVTNDKKEPLTGVIVNLYSNNSDELLDYKIADENGNFTFDLKKNTYKVELQALGFEKTDFTFSLDKNIHKVFALRKDTAKEIKEVIITETRPIKIKGDTVEYNAKSFRDGSERSIEDLLKKLPGVSVDSNGKIKIRGKEIEKVMVENDDFFERGYTLLTKNMSDKPIEKIQILENYSNNKLLKGIEKSDKIVINLTLHEKAKTQWFGELYSANSVFPNTYFNDKISLARFGKKYKYFFIGSANNFGKDNVGDIQHLLTPTSLNEAGYININNQLFTYNSDFNQFLNIDIERYKLNNDKLISNNFIFRLSDNIKLKLINLSNFERIFSNTISKTSFNFGSENFDNIEEQVNHFKKNSFFNKLEYDHDISKNSTLKIIFNYSLWSADRLEQSNLNDIASEFNSTTKNHLLDSSILHTQKLNHKSVLLTSLRYFNQYISNNFLTNQFLFQDLFNLTEKPDFFGQNSNNSIKFSGVLSQYIYKNSNDGVFDLSLQFSNSQQRFFNIMNVKNNINTINLPSFYSNDISNESTDFILRSSYKFIYSKIKFSLQLNTHHIDYQNNNFKRAFWYLNPNFNFSFLPHYKGNLFFLLYMNNKTNNMYNLLPNYFSNSPRSLRRGQENEILFNNVGTSLRYSYGHFTDKLSLNLFTSYENATKYPSSHFTIKPLYSTDELIYFRNRSNFLWSGELNYYLRFIKSNFKMIYVGSKSKYKEMVNGSTRDVHYQHNSIGLELKSGWKKSINYTIGNKLNFTKIKIVDVSEITNQQMYLKINYNITKKLYLQFTDNYYSFGSAFNQLNSYNFLDGQLTYDYNDELKISLLGNNLTNTKKFQQISINSYSNYSYEALLFPRNIMLEIHYNFGKK